MRRLLIFPVLALLSLAVPAAASVEDVITEIETGQAKNCERPAGSIDRLIAAIGASTDAGQQARGLQTLSEQYLWTSANPKWAFNTIHEVGKGSETLELLAARALEVAKGELRSAALSMRNDPDAYETYLRKLIRHNDGRNRFYKAMAQAVLADHLQRRVLETHQRSELPIARLSETDSAAMQEAIALYTDLRDFYGPLSKSSNLYSRDLTLDFDYQIALLQFVTGSPEWQPTLQELIDTEGAKDPFDRSQEARHIYVYSFLRPPLRSVEVEVSSSSFGRNKGCPQNRSEQPTRVVQQTSNAIVKRFYNPTQLALWTCAKLGNRPSSFTLDTMISSLTAFENHDYRVVLGHYRNGEVRYSDFTLDDLRSEAARMQQVVADEFEATSSLAALSNDGPCDPSGLASPPSTHVRWDTQGDGKTRGYIYLGDGLMRDDAKRLLALVTSFDDFSNAYLIRPRID